MRKGCKPKLCLWCGEELEEEYNEKRGRYKNRERRYHLKCYIELHNEIPHGEVEALELEAYHEKPVHKFSRKRIDPMKMLRDDYVRMKLAGQIKIPKGLGKQIVLIKMDEGLSWD